MMRGLKQALGMTAVFLSAAATVCAEDGYAKAKWDNSKKPVESFGDAAWDEKFHVWRMDWDEKSIVLSLDGLTLNTVDLAEAVNPEGRGPRNLFRQPFYLLLNLAISGDSGGDPSQTPFPSRYEIDYVRVYQKVAAH